MYGHQLMLPVPDVDRTQLLPGRRRQPDGLQRHADDGAGLPGPAARPQGPRRPDGGDRPAAHRDRQGRRTSTTSCGPAPTPRCCWRCCTCCSTRGSPRPPAYVDGLDAVREAVAGFTPELAERVSGLPRRRGPRPRARPRRRDVGRRATGGWGLDPGLRRGLPVGGAAAQPAHRQPRPARAARCSPRPAVDVVGRGLLGPGPPRRVAQPGARAAGVRRRAARCRRCAEEIHDARARARCGPCSRSPATRCRRPPTGAGSTRRSRGSTSWWRSTSTSTRPPGTPT